MANENNILVFDIETLPQESTPSMESLLSYKVRNYPADKIEGQKLHYSFHEPQFAKVVCIGMFYDGVDGQFENQIFNRNSEEDVVKEFIQYITEYCDAYRSAKFVHFNGLDFDVPFILYKCAQYGITPPARFCNLVRFRTDPHYDIMQVLSAWGKFAINLREACISFGVIDSKEALNNEDVLTFLAKATDEEIRKYNMEDVKSTYQVFKKVIKIYQ